MTDLERFCSAMDYPWVVERYELDGQDRLTVHYRSQRYMDVSVVASAVHIRDGPQSRYGWADRVHQQLTC
jgi:hypothetical protein